jgi:hypothetical protein
MARRNDLFALVLTDFVQKAIEEAWEVPPDYEKWSSPMFELTRWIKGHPEFAKLEAFDAADLLEQVLINIGEGAPDDPWQRFGDSDDPRAEFIATWDKVKTPANMDALEVAWRQAERLPLRPLKKYSKKYCEFVSLAGHLQNSRPDRPIALPLERISTLLDSDRRMTSQYIRFAVKEGLLVKASAHVPHRRAAEYVFDVRRFDWETGLEDLR